MHWVLYDRILNVTPETADDPERDRLLLSKGHGPASYYAVLAAKGFMPVAELAGFGGFDSPLGHHPDAALIAGVEIASGSLGHGLPIAVGRALALRAAGRSGPRVVCVLGDGELAEGSNHEAIALAGRLGLDRLIAVVVDNFSATYGWPDGVADRFANEGWTTASAHARDHDALERAIIAGPAGPPARRRRDRGGMTWRACASASRRVTSEALDDDPRLALVLADIGVDGFEHSGAMVPAPGARDQRRHPRAADDRRRRAVWRRRACGRSSTATRRSSSSGRSSRSSSTSATRMSAPCWSASARPTTPHPRGARIRRPGDVALLATLPGFAIHVPGHPDEAEQLLRREFARDGRAYVRLSGEANAEAQPVEQLTVVRAAPRRQPASCWPSGRRSTRCWRRRPTSPSRLPTPRPSRPSPLPALRAVATGRDVAIVEPYLAGTSAAALAEALSDEPRRLLALGVPPIELRRYGKPDEHRRAYGLDAEGIRRSLDAFLASTAAAA